MWTIFGSHVTVFASRISQGTGIKSPQLGLQAQGRANFKWNFQVIKVCLNVLPPLVPFSYARGPFIPTAVTYTYTHAHKHMHTPNSVKLKFSGLLHPARAPADFHFCKDQSFNPYRLSPRNSWISVCKWRTEVTGAQEGQDQQGTLIRGDRWGSEWKAESMYSLRREAVRMKC